MKKNNLWYAAILVIAILLTACAGSDLDFGNVVSGAGETEAEEEAPPEEEAAPAEEEEQEAPAEEAAPEEAEEPSEEEAEPAEESEAAPSGESEPGVVLSTSDCRGGDQGYESETMDEFEYTWDYSPLTDWTTPEIRDDATSTGTNQTVCYDIGVHEGEFGIVKGYGIELGGESFGGDPNGCALIALSPGYYYGIAVTDGRWEVYNLPNSDPLDPTGWSKVLAEQAMQVEHQLYDCAEKDLNEIPVFFSDVEAPFAQ